MKTIKKKEKEEQTKRKIKFIANKFYVGGGEKGQNREILDTDAKFTIRVEQFLVLEMR